MKLLLQQSCSVLNLGKMVPHSGSSLHLRSGHQDAGVQHAMSLEIMGGMAGGAAGVAGASAGGGGLAALLGALAAGGATASMKGQYSEP